jgi:hypothetical protein
VLRDRLDEYRLPSRDEDVEDYFEDRSMEIEADKGVTDGGLPVALVVISMPDPSLTSDDEDDPPDTNVFTWLDWITRRDTGFLAVQ